VRYGVAMKNDGLPELPGGVTIPNLDPDLDPEVIALSRVHAALIKLGDESARRRVLDWARSRFLNSSDAWDKANQRSQCP